MTRTDLVTVRPFLIGKQAELSVKSRNLKSIPIERNPEMIEELQYKSDRELAIVGLNRDSAVRRNIELALIRSNDSFGACGHCEEEISRRRLVAMPWAPFCVRRQEAADRGGESVLESIEPIFLDAA
jgi:RNA polymerase-binding transcription factor DksA